MQLHSAKNEEKLVNNILFIFNLAIPIAGCAFVMLFLNGGPREWFVLSISLGSLITKAFEKLLGNKAKYIYACLLPVLGAITIAISSTNDSAGYICITHCYFVATLLLVPYYNQRLLRVNVIATILANTTLMIFFPAGFLKLHSLIGWIFIAIVYIVFFAGCSFIVHRVTTLFGVVEDKEKNLKMFCRKFNPCRSIYILRELRYPLLPKTKVPPQRSLRQPVKNWLATAIA